jgi:hypothetical protein
MKKYLFILILISIKSCQAQKSIIQDNVTIVVSTYKSENKTKVSAMPEIKKGSELMNYKKRFEYLLINVSEIHSPSKAKERDDIWKFYPDTTELKRLYLNKYIEDKKLVSYFEETAKYIKNTKVASKISFTQDELMEVASKFFYCDKVMPDTIVQAHICVGLNGVKEAKWEKDYTLLQAFCYEAIFNQLDNETSQIWDTFVSEKRNATDKFKMNITSLDQFLHDVKLELFKRMKNNETLKNEILAYYEMNKNNLAFKIVK